MIIVCAPRSCLASCCSPPAPPFERSHALSEPGNREPDEGETATFHSKLDVVSVGFVFGERGCCKFILNPLW